MFGSVAEDSLRMVVHDAVTANQRANACMATAYRSVESSPLQALEKAQQALVFAQASGDPVLEHKALVCLGGIEERLGLFNDRMTSALEALRLAQGLADPLTIALDLRELSKAYLMMGRSDLAVEEARNSLAVMLPTRPVEEVEDAELFLVSTLVDAGHYEEALSRAMRSLAKLKDQADPQHLARYHAGVGVVLVAQGKYSDAIVHLTQAEGGLPASAPAQDRFEVQEALTKAHIGLGRTKEARTSLGNANTVAEETGSWSHRHRILELRYGLARAENEWREAVGLLESIKQANDSLLVARADMQTARLQMSFRMEGKEKVNAELRDENARSAEIIAGTTMYNKVLLFLSLLLCVLVIALVFTGRHGRRVTRRLKLKNAVVKRQHDEIHAKNLELQRQNLRLAETLMSEEEKDLMIKEIHHRVKNNLQVVDSLLQLQTIDSADPGIAKVVREAQGRIRSMALVHEQIYRSNSGAKGDLRFHLEKLVRNILAAYGAHDRISVQVDTTLPTFHMECLLPLTLVVNELFTNAVKYAFTNHAPGRVTIVVRAAGNGYELLFHDDGPGFGTQAADGQRTTFGLELVKMLAEQLNGKVRYLTGAGSTVHLTFVPDAIPLRVAS
ncbi:MAG: sensor histidine kinase [Flavobacteriales bacterium]|nr:sensor histidine kinase [Flavobacteriales bacterium]